MASMYDKLGDLLKDALDKGEIPHKQQETQEIPENIKIILNILKVENPLDKKEISTKYHELLKKLHPDTRDQNGVYIIYNGKQLDINTLQNLYKTVEEYFKNNQQN